MSRRPLPNRTRPITSRMLTVRRWAILAPAFFALWIGVFDGERSGQAADTIINRRSRQRVTGTIVDVDNRAISLTPGGHTTPETYPTDDYTIVRWEALQAIQEYAKNERRALSQLLAQKDYARASSACDALELKFQGFSARGNPTSGTSAARSYASDTTASLRELIDRLQLLPSRDKINTIKPTELNGLLAELKTISEALDADGPIATLGPAIKESVAGVRADVDVEHRLVKAYASSVAGLLEVEQAADALKSGLSTPGEVAPSAAHQQFSGLLQRLQSAEEQVDAQPKGPVRDYGVQYASDLRKRVENERRDLLLEVHRYFLEQLRSQANSISTTEQIAPLQNELKRARGLLDDVAAVTLGSSQKAELDQCNDLFAEVQARVKCQDAAFRLDSLATEFESQVQRGLRGLDGPIEHIQSVTTALDQITQEVEEARHLHPAVADDALATLGKIDDLRVDDFAATVLLTAQRDLATVPRQIEARDVLERAEAINAGVESRLAASASRIAASKAASLGKLHAAVIAQLEGTRRVVKDCASLVRFRELETDVRTSLDDGTAALSQKQLCRTSLLVQTLRRQLALLQEHLAANAGLQKDAALVGLLATYRARFDALASQLSNEWTSARRAAGWHPLPVESGPLAPPTPASRLLEIQLLLADERFSEAASQLDQLREAGLDSALSAQADRLRARLAFLQAARAEAQGEWSKAVQQYQQVAIAERDPVLREAASVAKERLQQELQQDRDPQDRSTALLLLATAFLGGTVAGVWQLCRNSTRGRLRRARREFELADACASRGDMSGRDYHLAAGATILSPLKENDPRVLELRRQSPKGNDLLGKTPDVNVALPDADAILDHIIQSPEANAPLAGACLDLLERCTTDRPPAFIKPARDWLRRCLIPARTQPPDELRWRAEACGRCARLWPRAVWPVLYEAAIWGWLGDLQAAAEPAARLDATLLPKDEHASLQMVLGQVWLRIGKQADAVQLFESLCRRPETQPEAEQWLKIAKAKEAVAQGKVLSLKRIESLLAG